MIKYRVFVLFAFLVTVFAVSEMRAQVLYGSLIGTVSDQSGAVVPTATVTISNAQTGQSRETATDSEGRFSLQNVQAGTYEMKVTSAGFRTLTRTNVAISINTVTRVPVLLEVGQVTEQVTVEGAAAALQTDKTDVHVEIGETQVRNLPLPRYRNYQSLINLVPGATLDWVKYSIESHDGSGISGTRYFPGPH